MMQFLRRHQKKLFLVIAAVTAISFAYLGTSSGFSGGDVEDKKIGKTIDGKAIYERDLRAVTQFLSMGSSDVIQSDFIETGAFSLLAEKYFADIKDDFEERVAKARFATFYTHPQVPFLNAVQVWNRFSPDLMRHYQQMLSGSIDAKTFTTYAKLYMDQQKFPPELLAMLLSYEQQNYSWITPDYKLNDPRSLALFGYQSFEEWFGPRFSEILGKFIFNTAAVAEKRGYKVSLNEARSDFGGMVYQAARMKTMNREMTPQEGDNFMRIQLHMAGIDESRAVHLWRKVMLVHRFFQDVQQGVLVDPVAYEQFATFADAKASVDVYQLPEVLRLRDFQSMLQVQYYLEAIGPKVKHELPKLLYSVEEIEKKNPDLVTSRYELEVAKISEEDVLSRLNLRQMWDFETSDAGWFALTAQFPILNKPDSLTLQGREKILDACDKELRNKIDRSARQMLIKKNPEWISGALQAQPLDKVVVNIKSRGATAPFDDIEETASLRDALHKTEIGQTITFASKNHYLIKVVQKPAKKEVMTLQEARESGLLAKLLDAKLEALLPEARKKESAVYKDADGAWKPFAEVRDHVGAFAYQDLLKNISDSELTFSEYAAKRFEKMMNIAQLSVIKENGLTPYLNPSGNALLDQWRLIKRHKVFKRSDSTHLPKNEMFTNSIGSWSTVVAPIGGDVSFFHLLERDNADLKIDDQVAAGQRLIGREVMVNRIEKLLGEVGCL